MKLDILKFDAIEKQWCRACCEVTYSNHAMGFVPEGFVTSTKHGDGIYPAGIKYIPGTKEVAYIRLVTDFICECCGKERCDCETSD